MVRRPLACVVVWIGLAGCGVGSEPVAEGSASETGLVETGSTDGGGDGDGDPGDGDGEPGEGDGDGEPGDGDGDPTDAPRVLFIGNSYTSVNQLPILVEQLGANSPTPIIVNSLTMGGATVQDHLDNTGLGFALSQGVDVVVIQGQSVEPILDYPGFEAAVIELTAMSGDARVLLFETWPREQGSPDLIDLGMTVEEMYTGLSSGYFEASLASETEVAAVGTAWMSALQVEPAIDLYATDHSHPAIAGSYLAACVFFGKIVDRACSTSSFVPAEINEDIADQIQVIADITNGIVNPSP